MGMNLHRVRAAHLAKMLLVFSTIRIQ